MGPGTERKGRTAENPRLTLIPFAMRVEAQKEESRDHVDVAL